MPTQDGTTIHLIRARSTQAPLKPGSKFAAPPPYSPKQESKLQPDPEPEQLPPPRYTLPPATGPQAVASAPLVSAMEPPLPPVIRQFHKAPLAPTEVMRPPPSEMSLQQIHEQSAERLKKQLGTLMSAAPKADQDFGKRLEQGTELLNTTVATVDAEWRCIIQFCNDSMASNILQSQTHKSHVAQCVGWVQTNYIDCAPDVLKEQRRAINHKAEQIALTGGRVSSAASSPSALPPAEPPSASTGRSPSPSVHMLELVVRVFCCEGGEMKLFVSPTTAIGKVIEDLEAITGPSPDPSRSDILVVLGRRLERAHGTVGDCELQHGQTLYLIGSERTPPRPLPITWTVQGGVGAGSYQQQSTAYGSAGAAAGTSGDSSYIHPPQAVLPSVPQAVVAPSAPPPVELSGVSGHSPPPTLPPNRTGPPNGAADAPAPAVAIESPDTVSVQAQPQLPRRASSSASDPWFEMPTREAWGDNPGLRISYDVAESETKIVERALAKSTNANGEVSDPALLVLQSELQAAMLDLETRLEQGLLSLSDYATQLHARIMADKRSALASKKSGDVEMAKRLLRHTKLMQHELDEIRKEAPTPAPSSSKAGKTAGAGGQKEYKSEAARAVQAMMNEFHSNMSRMDRTTAAQQAELEAELNSMWSQQHGAPPPSG